MIDYGKDLFKGTAWYYARYRPLYPASLIRHLVDKFALDGEGRLLDLGCGTGQLVLRFQDWFEDIVGIDPEPEMLEEARRLSLEHRVSHVQWLEGKAEDRAGDLGSYRLVTIAKAFHWMDRETVLDLMYRHTVDRGGIAIIGNDSEKHEPLPWQLKVNEVVAKWLGKERRAGNSTYQPPTERFEDTLAKSRYQNIEKHVLPPYAVKWTTESIIGNLYSTSFGARRFFGDDLERFEDELRSALLAINPSDEFVEEQSIAVITGMKLG
ncbi:class I SAM-dependent methyltransferase [Paenibacillus guangzhouensis]|uniref:class I SAM-dependent methyltransferase n=1 Tax=Paenibacillus guangzhouensis TaxID=1473112 RepID=UPI0012670C75|nr:class I SAM-dependent methyltransferase [Paenibacillus guangzhouensis]